MNPYAPFLLAALDITEATKSRYPLGEVIDVTAAEERDRILVSVTTKMDDRVDAAISNHRSFLRKQTDEHEPTIVTYILAVPSEHKQLVRDCLARPDYPHGA